jgi:hypothetical protein
MCLNRLFKEVLKYLNIIFYCTPTCIFDLSLISHKYRGSSVAFSISKSVEPNEEQNVG